MPLVEPFVKRAMAFVDGQNLFHHARNAFGYHYPNYDIRALVEAVCALQGWQIEGIHFYTGVPDSTDNPAWNRFWNNRLAAMGRQGISVFTRPLKYRNQVIRLPDGSTHSFLHGEEKGIDVRIALDVIGKAVRNEYDVALVFSQDQDLSEVADEIRLIARQQDRWIRIACAYPNSPTSSNRRASTEPIGSSWIVRFMTLALIPRTIGKLLEALLDVSGRTS